jgi:UDP-glucose 4-epimerase
MDPTTAFLIGMNLSTCPAVFSSSATVYGNGTPPFTEDSPTGIDIPSPYGQTKYMAERILQDCAKADPKLKVALLRYFNPVGAHPSGIIGEDPRGIPNNLVPVIQRVATGKIPQLTVFGKDYDTPDGTAQRDYIHVVDLAIGHVKAIQWLQGIDSKSSVVPTGKSDLPNCGVFNLGTGTKHTVLEVVSAFEKACGFKIPYSLGDRRAGDVPAVWAETKKAKDILGWEAKLSLESMVTDSWRWCSNNPQGYDTPAPGAAAATAGSS